MSGSLAQAPGLVLRERVYISQLLCKSCEKKTSFAVGLWNGMDGHINDPALKGMLRSPGAWLGEVREESNCCCRYCLHQNREAQLGYFLPEQLDVVAADYVESGPGGLGWPQGRTPEVRA